MTTVTIQDTAVQLTAVATPSWLGAEARTYEARVAGRLVGTVTRYRHTTHAHNAAGTIRVGSRTAWAWRYDTATAVVKAAQKATSFEHVRYLQRGLARYSRTDALVELLTTVTHLDAMAARIAS
jgi:hypothetical protein